MNVKLKEKIIELYNKGYSYDKIKQKLCCSKGTISYHLGFGQKEKTLKRQINRRQKDPLKQKYKDFINRSYNSKILTIKNYNINNILSSKIKTFSNGNKNMFTLEELKNKIGENPKCYLTGRPIDLSKSRSYELDHIIPSSKGGDNSIKNCGLACREANRAKFDMTLEEFYKLCQDVVKNLDIKQ